MEKNNLYIAVPNTAGIRLYDDDDNKIKLSMTKLNFFTVTHKLNVSPV